MRFVSRHPAYRMTIIDETQKAEVDINGVTRYVRNGKGYDAQWEKRTLTDADRTAAEEQILARGGRYAFGSVPGRDEGNINVQDAGMEGYSSTTHEGFDVWQRLSLFDTEDPMQCPPEYKEMVEDFLCNHYELGLDYVRVDNYNLTPPWPNYPTPDQDVEVARIVNFAQFGGFVNAALAYENASYKRADLIEALEVAAQEELKKTQEDIALSAIV